MFPKVSRAFTTFLFLFLTSCAFLAGATPAERLAELDTAIVAGDYGDINSLLVWHDGTLVWEAYYRGANANTAVQVYSVTKSVTSAMIGRALAEEQLAGLDELVLPLFPEYTQIDNRDGRKEAITLADLLTMRAGFAWDELSTIYGNEVNDVTHLTRSGDWTKYMLDREMAADPGTTFTYNSGVTMLLGDILERAGGRTAEAYTAEHLFGPLGITEWQWETTPRGHSNTGWGLYLRPVDMVKFGQLYLQEGEWAGEQLIPDSWVAASTRPVVRIDEAYDYGYQWWRFADQNPVVADLAENDLYFAWGFGGNFIFVVPHLDLVITTTAENFENSSQFFPALSDYIFPGFIPE